MDIRRTMIVPAALAEQARQAAANASPAGAGMFATPLYSGGEEPTHYISTGAIDAGFGQLLADPDLLAQVGQISQADAQALVDQSVVVDLAEETAHETIARLGLALRREDEE